MLSRREELPSATVEGLSTNGKSSPMFIPTPFALSLSKGGERRIFQHLLKPWQEGSAESG
jgi:hypothetical protein